MSLTRSESRVIAMTILYQIDLFKRKKIDIKVDDIIQSNLEEDNEFVKELVYGVMEHESELIRLSNLYLNNWDISRLGITDAQILKLAVYELLYTDTPKRVCIDEAIELAKRYSDFKVVAMINGVLDKVYHNELKR